MSEEPVNNWYCLEVYSEARQNYGCSWWRHQMETFSALLVRCAGNSPVTSEFPPQRAVMRSFDVFFDLPLNRCLSNQSWGWWFETPSGLLWRHCNGCPGAKATPSPTLIKCLSVYGEMVIELWFYASLGHQQPWYQLQDNWIFNLYLL